MLSLNLRTSRCVKDRGARWISLSQGRFDADLTTRRCSPPGRVRYRENKLYAPRRWCHRERDTAAIGVVSKKLARRRKLDSLSPLFLLPSLTLPEALSDVDVRRRCDCLVYLYVRMYAREGVYIHVARRCRKTPSRSSDGTEVLHR